MYEKQQAITRHGKLLENIKVQLKARMKAHNDNGNPVYIDPDDRHEAKSISDARWPKPPKREQGCRHHVRKQSQGQEPQANSHPR